ncbi:unnamed protein product [Lupinus luteus]|uniref:Uncharacterized protein n=1 Tax=Lupinus luteus TaxID=3873 RepID=A0AAV1XQW2_LUPLU
MGGWGSGDRTYCLRGGIDFSGLREPGEWGRGKRVRNEWACCHTRRLLGESVSWAKLQSKFY